MVKKPLLYATRIAGITQVTFFGNGKKIRFLEHDRVKQTLLDVSYSADSTRVNFFEQGELIACLEEKMLAEMVIDIAVSAGSDNGRLVCHLIDGEFNIVGRHNLPLVLKWIRRCQAHLRLPL